MSDQTVLHGWRFHALLLIVFLSALGYLGFSLWGGWQEVTAAIFQVGIPVILLALLLSLVNYGLRFIRWQKFLSRLGHHIYWQESLRIYIAGFGLTILPGKVGETIRSVFLKQHNVSYPESLAAFFSEMLSNLISMVLLASFGLWAFPQAQPMVIVVTGLILFALIFLQQAHWLKFTEHIIQRHLHPRLAKLFTGGIEIVLHSKRCFTLPMLSYGLMLGIVSWGAEGVAFYFILHALGSDITLQVAVFIYAFAMIVGAVSFLPGGLGGTEATMLALLLLNQISEPHAVAATILIRLATLWYAVALGMIALSAPKRTS